MVDNFEDYTIPIDSECVTQDFDDIDLYGEKIVENSDIDSELEFE